MSSEGGRSFIHKDPGSGSAGKSLLGLHSCSTWRRILSRDGHQDGQGAVREEGRDEMA